MKNRPFESTAIYIRLILAVLALALIPSHRLFAQTIEVTFDTPDQADICGAEAEIAVILTNTDSVDAVGLTGQFDIIPFADLVGVDAPATLVGNDIMIGDLDAGETVRFIARFQIGCEYSENDFDQVFTLTGGGSGSFSPESIQVVSADLSIPSTSPSVLGVYLGLTTSVEARVVNNGFGSLDELTYCVTNTLGNMELQAIFVGTVDITAAGPAFSTATQDCYTIHSAALVSAGLGPALDQGESVYPREDWLVTECVSDPEAITRRVQFGCLGNLDCQEKPQSEFQATGVSYEILAPNIDIERVSSTSPACYMTENTRVVMRLTNNGNAPAKDIRFRLLTNGNGSRSMAFEMSTLSALYESSATTVDDVVIQSTLLATDCRAPGVRDATIELQDVDLAIGESVLISYELSASCECNNCDIRNKYWNRFRLEGYDDPCDKSLVDRTDLDVNGRFDAMIRGFPEGPSTLGSGGEGCFTYNVTDAQLDWLNSSYPDAYLEAVFNLPCGLDYVPESFSWTDRDGMAYTVVPDSVFSEDNGSGADDMLRVRFAPSGRPANFNTTGGMTFSFCAVVDCSEKPVPPVCGSPSYDVEIEAQFNFTTDPDCPSDCAIQKIWAPENINTRIMCPPMAGCVCDGMNFDNLVIERANFGIGDSNNDQIPDGMLDSSKVQRDRFLQGDSIRVLLEGTVRDVDDNLDFDHGYVIYPLQHENFSPLGVTVSIFDDDGGQYTCMAVPITPDYTNQRIIIDYSVPTLSGFGCLPANFLYEHGDSIAIEFFYTEKDMISQQFRILDYEPSFFLSEDALEMGPTYQCNSSIGRLTQIGFTTASGYTDDDFGSCEQPTWAMRFDRNIGGAGVDEFPCEIRPIGLPDRLVFNKPSAYNFRLDNWDIILHQRISPANNIVDTRSLPSPSIPAQYFVVDGDEVTFLVGDYLESLGLAEIPPDEGYRILIYPRIQGTCESIAENDIPYSYQFFAQVDENIFCVPEIATDVINRTFDYLGAARLLLLTDLSEIRLCSGNEVATVRVRNVETPAATNSFLYPDPTGGVIITSIVDANSGVEIEPNEFGIYELGTINGTSERELLVSFIKNSCDREEINFIAGWDCLGYPTTINDAICTDPSTIVLTSANSNVDMVVRTPAPSESHQVDLCDPVPYEVDILSTDLGYVRDLFLRFKLPPNQVYVPGSFEISIPSPSLGGTYVSTIDPTPTGGNNYEIDIAALDGVLNTQGLVGSKDPANSIISIRFEAVTECGYLSGSRARFFLRSNNSCGDPLRVRRRRSGRVRIRRDEPSLVVDVTPETLQLNACNGETATTGIDIEILAGEVAAVDSVRIVLPAGLNYVPGSYVPGTNAPAGTDPPVIRNISGQTVLLWPLSTALMPGEMIDFDLDIVAEDVGQECSNFDLLVEAFTVFESTCNGMVCDVAELSGEGIQTVEIQKAELDFNFIDGDITLDPASGNATADFDVEVCNSGFVLNAGNVVTVDIYEDVNGNGSLDEGTDLYLFSVDSTLVDPLNPGQCLTISDQATFPASQICTVIGVLNPNNTCTCAEVPSNNFRPDIIYDFPTEYGLCSGDTELIGAEPIAGFDYEWLSYEGSDLANLSATDQSMVTFTAPNNNSGEAITLSYILRTSNAPCFTDDTVNITIQPIVMDVVMVNECLGASVDLPTISDPGATDFVWTSAGGGPLTVNGRFATIEPVTGSETYTLTYNLGGDCDAQYVVEVNAIDCGNANTALGDTVWFDIDQNGQYDLGEPGIGGVTVNLIDANTGTVIGTTTTDVDGYYIFDMLPAGNYAVEFIPLDGFVFTGQNIGSDDSDSDADPTTGQTPGMYLGLGEQDFTIDAGLVPDCNLEIELIVGDCIISGDTLARPFTITATWSGNPWAYDQFNDGMDTIDYDLNGETFSFPVDDIMGSVVLKDSLLAPETSTTYVVSAQFREASTCGSTDMAGPFEPCVYDLALIKIPSEQMPTPGPYAYGDQLCMDIVVFNQGALPVDRVQVFDTLPAGFAFDEANSPGWSNLAPLQLYQFPDPIPAGESDTATICVTLVMTNGGATDFTNLAEINSFTNENGVDVSNFDEDSSPDQNFGNDPGGNPGTGSDDAVDGDGSGSPGDTDPTTDEDDHDPFEIAVADLALIKRLTTSPFYVVGNPVTYTMEVFNQGNITAQDIRVIDYIPDGFAYMSAANPGWGPIAAYDANYDTVSIVIPGPLEPGEMTTVSITLQLTGVVGNFNYRNQAEISEAFDESGMPLMDIDGTFDYTPDNDAGGTAMSGSDNVIDGDGTGVPGDSNSDTDEDNADPELLAIDSVSIGSTVFIDFNDNGVQDGTENGVADVRVELLLDANGNMMIDPSEETPVAVTFTNDDGDYYFGMLLPGNYVVQIPPVNFGHGQALGDFATSSTFSSPSDDNMDGNDDGSQPDGAYTAVRSPVVNLVPTMEPTAAMETFQGGSQDDDNGQDDANGNMTVDFGFQPNVALGSTVFVDADDNGFQDSSEPGIEGVTLYVYYDLNDNGMIDAAEMMPYDSTTTDVNGDYIFMGLPPGNYQVVIPDSQFQPDSSLQFAQVSSTDVATTDADNMVDGDDNGLQPGGMGTVVVSPLIGLQPGSEPTTGNEETEQGNDQDDAFDSNGDMTIDFGFICLVEIELTDGQLDLCSTDRIALADLIDRVTADLPGIWSTSGDGTFLGSDGNEISPATYANTVAYMPGPNDSRRGTVTLTLTSNDDGSCPDISDSVEIEVRKVSCGEFFWDGQ